jgi:signal transduction histidine kinase
LRAALAWAAGALILSVALSSVAYALVRNQLVDDRQDRATAQAFVNARAVRNVMRTTDPDLNTVLGSLSSNAQSATLTWVDGRWYAGSVGAGPDLLPTAIQQAVASGDAGSQVADVAGDPYVVVGVPLPESDAQYFELVRLDDIEASLSALARGMTVATIVATVLGATAGWYVSRRVLRPVRTMATAAEQIAGGDLTARLDAFGDPELEPLQRSFNDMADAVESRIEREQRFTSDVSHELRTPLTAMLSSVQLARRHIDDPEAVDRSLAQLEDRADGFREVVLGLLEISKVDAGVADLVLEPLTPADLVRAVLTSTGRDGVPVVVAATAPQTVYGDKRRLGQVLQNLLDNADRYGGGATRVLVGGDETSLVMTVEDAGPGVPEHERSHVLNRFARGETASGRSEGSGLGLALVVEHMRLHGGTVEIADSPSGGASVSVTMPVGPAEPVEPVT